MTIVLDAARLPVVWMIVRISLLLAGAGLAHTLFGQRMSAAARHLLWTLTIVGLLILPVLSATIPAWDAVRLPPASQRDAAAPVTSTDRGEVTTASTLVAADRAATTSATSPRTSLAPSVQWSTVLVAIYVIGLLLLTARLAAERWTMRTLARWATDVHDPEWMRLHVACAQAMDLERPVR